MLNENTFTTGFENLDRYFSDVPKNSLITLGARPSMGKTAFAVNIAKNTGIYKNILIFSLEMKTEQMIKRLLWSIAKISFDKLNCNKLNHIENIRLKEAQNALEKSNIYIDDSPVLMVKDLKNKYKKAQEAGYNFDLVIIDYLQLMDDESKIDINDIDRTRTQEISNIMNGLNDFAKTNNVTVLLLTQHSIIAEYRVDKKPILSDFSESKSIVELSDVVMLLYRDIYTKEKANKYITEINIAKNNFGKTGRVNLEFIPAFYEFKELEEI